MPALSVLSVLGLGAPPAQARARGAPRSAHRPKEVIGQGSDAIGWPDPRNAHPLAAPGRKRALLAWQVRLERSGVE